MALSNEQYTQLRNRLMMYFNRRGCAAADDLADETLYRLTAKLAAGVEIAPDDIERYVISIARNIWHETSRNPLNFAEPIEDPQTGKPMEISSHDEESLQRLVDEATRKCRDKCLAIKLTEEERHLILEYYKDDWHEQVESRKRLLKTLNISKGTLGSTASRILEKLETCMKKCLGVHK